MTMEKLMDLLVYSPRARFGLPAFDGFSVWDIEKEFTVDPDTFLSKGKATPFAGEKLTGVCMLTVSGGKTVYKHSDI